MMTDTLSVAEVMSRNVLFAHLDHSFTELCRLFFELNIHHLPVIDEEGQLIGIVSANDVLKAYGRRLPMLRQSDEATLNKEITIESIMTPNPVSARPDTSLKKAAELLTANNIQSLPIVDDGRVVGIITSRDLVRHLAEVQ
jgi:acetoin utilization protein AcuB